MTQNMDACTNLKLVNVTNYIHTCMYFHKKSVSKVRKKIPTLRPYFLRSQSWKQAFLYHSDMT